MCELAATLDNEPDGPADDVRLAKGLALMKAALALLDDAGAGVTMTAVHLCHAIDTLQGNLAPMTDAEVWEYIASIGVDGG